ncbi:MAG: TonB-dependent receptor [Pseudomonadota bacterium]
MEIKPTRWAALLGATLVMGMGTAPTMAQEEDDNDTIENVVVTGSRVARDPNLASPAPVQTVSSEDIQLSGELDIADVINDIPSLLTTTTGEGSVDGVFASSVGQNVLQLRGMGAERTLVLVNGRRHVSGVAGSQAVDIGSIPAALIERVEVLTGGASAIYGADAVTGVVNFVLKEDFEGFDLDFQSGLSSRGDGETYNFSGLWGTNFDEDRGNVTVALDLSRREELTFADRAFSRNNNIGRNQPNPDLRFQRGEINPTDTPNLFQFYNINTTGRYPVGFRIPSAADFSADFLAELGSAPTLTGAEQALFDRAANAPVRAIRRRPTFSISSNGGVIAPSDFGDPALDLNGNGVPDCQDSSVGYQSSLNFPFSFGIAGGCWNIDENGSVRPYRDGLVVGVFNQFDGDGIRDNFDPNFLIPSEDKVTLNLNARYELADNVRLFGEIKWVDSEVEFGGPLNTFYDLLSVFPDNPFIPAELQALATASAPNDIFGQGAGLYITRDPTDLGPNISKNERQTVRFVAGLEGEFDNGMTYEVSANYGKFDRTLFDRNAVIQDRWFAAVDVTTDANGNPICRSDISTAPSPTTPFGIPLFDPGFYTFNPGDGQCRPANIFGGPGSISQEAVDFITTTDVSEFEIDQLVFSAIFTGETQFGLEAGGWGYAFGAEYREEESTSTFSGLARGVLPVTTAFGNAGDLLTQLGTSQSSLIFDPASLIQNSTGTYDVWEVYGELNVPLLSDAPGAYELGVDAAVRYADYSTIGAATTWKVGARWAPVQDVSFRGTFSEAIRAPNIFELFDPDQGAFFRPDDPCDQALLDALIADGDPRATTREANCRADGIPVGYLDPLSARFSGVTGGNPDLTEETAETITAGFVFQPRFLEGLTLSADYWSIEIEDAIDAVDDQDIVDNCYDSTTFPNDFCTLFTRNRDPNSAQFLGFNFLRQTQINFGKIESSGVDFAAVYAFDVGENAFNLGVAGTFVNELDFFFDPGDPTAVDPELEEIQRPELAGNINVGWRRGPVNINWQTQYIGEQTFRGVEIETIDIIYGPAGLADETYVHDISFSYDFNDSIVVYGGVNNLGDEEPFITEQAFPVSPRGRYFFLGVNATFE